MFGAPIVIYLFLGGTGAGLSICAALCVLLTPKHLVSAAFPPRMRLRFLAPQSYCALLGAAFTRTLVKIAPCMRLYCSYATVYKM